LFSALNRYDGAISQCIGQFRAGALTLEPIGPRVAPPRLWQCRRCRCTYVHCQQCASFSAGRLATYRLGENLR
jgi:hypothetical protein